MQRDIVDNQGISVQLERYTAKLLPYAYNIVGDMMEAEDVVQDVLNRYFLSSQDHVENPDGYLIRSVINRAINQKKLLRSRMERYLGEWLPTPVFTEEGIYTNVDKNQILNYSLLVLLERLNPKERAVFILKESFDFSHVEIAEILGITVESSRQLFKRSKEKLEPDLDRSFIASKGGHESIQKLADAIIQTDVETVKSLLAADVRSVSDGGNKMSAARKLISGKENVYKFLKAIYGKYLPPGAETRLTRINHHPAILYLLDGKVFRCAIFDIHHNAIERIYIVLNPDKLKKLQIQ